MSDQTATATETVDPIAGWRREDGALHNHSPWVDWDPSSKPTHHGGLQSICLDGLFTAAQLRAIADAMDPTASTK